MPKLKQPALLLKMAMNVLVDYFADYCHKSSVEGSVEKLRRGVAFIKEDVGPSLPFQLAPAFYERFLREFLGPDAGHIASHQRVVLEVIMDRKMIGLKCPNIGSLDMDDAHRIQGLQELVLDDRRCYKLDMFRLEDLTAITYIHSCTDSDLELINENCKKLKYLDIKESIGVTDEGLRALGSCVELRDVFVHGCEKVTHKGIQDFLSIHRKIERLYAWKDCRKPGFYCFSTEGWSVYPSIKAFSVIGVKITNWMLRKVTEKFPNLSSIEIIGNTFYSPADLSILGSLSKLSALDIIRNCNWNWDILEQLLKSNGANITSLRVTASSGFDYPMIQ